MSKETAPALWLAILRRLYIKPEDATVDKVWGALDMVVGRGTIQRIRSGDTDPKASTMALLAEKLECRVSDLFADVAKIEAPQSRGLAHPVSLAEPIVSIRVVAWEELVSADLSAPFQLRMPDDSLSPDFPAGSLLRFDPSRARRAGRPALIKDGSGNFYVRIYQAGANGRWQAIASGRWTPPMDSEADGLVYVAPLIGFDYAD